jgi:hypothetical protein
VSILGSELNVIAMAGECTHYHDRVYMELFSAFKKWMDDEIARRAAKLCRRSLAKERAPTERVRFSKAHANGEAPSARVHETIKRTGILVEEGGVFTVKHFYPGMQYSL